MKKLIVIALLILPTLAMAKRNKRRVMSKNSVVQDRVSANLNSVTGSSTVIGLSGGYLLKPKIKLVGGLLLFSGVTYFEVGGAYVHKLGRGLELTGGGVIATATLAGASGSGIYAFATIDKRLSKELQLTGKVALGSGGIRLGGEGQYFFTKQFGGSLLLSTGDSVTYLTIAGNYYF